MTAAQSLLAWDGWVPVLDGNPDAVALYERHYPAQERLARRRERGSRQFGGAGARMVLLLADRTVLFVWRRQAFRLDTQTGVECSVFRNEGARLSSDLVLEAEGHAWGRWPGARLFTFVDAQRTAARRSRRSRPGECFLRAGWRFCGLTARGLHILEKLP